MKDKLCSSNLSCYVTNVWNLNAEMATAQLTASSVTVSARNLASFEGLRPSTVKFASFGTLRTGALTQRSFRGLVVKAATVVAPKVSSGTNLLVFPVIFLISSKGRAILTATLIQCCTHLLGYKLINLF